MSVVDRRPLGAVVTVRTAVAVAVGYALVLGTLVGSTTGTVLAVAGALVFARGVGSLHAQKTARVALGNVGLVGGPVLVAAGAFIATDTLLVYVLSAGVAAVAAETVAGFTIETANEIVDMAKRSGVVLLVGGVCAVIGLSLFAIDVPSLVAAELFTVVTASSFVAFVWLQIGVLVGGILAAHVGTRVESMDIETNSEKPSSLASRVQIAPFDIPPWYLAALVAQFMLASWGPSVRFVSVFLDSRPVVGTVVTAVLLSGVLQALVAAILVILVSVLAAIRVKPVVVEWAGTDPATAVANAFAGFVVLVLATGLGIVLLSGLGSFVGLGPNAVTLRTVVGPVLGVLAAAVLVLGIVTTLFVATGIALDSLSTAAWGYGAGSVLLFGGTLLAAEAVSAVVVIAGAAVALFVWHLGVHAFDLEQDLDAVAPTQRSEVVHLTAAGVALTVGVATALVIGYVGAPLLAAVPTDRALTALTLVLVAVLAFGVVLRR